jgi:hypothetical protein
MFTTAKARAKMGRAYPEPIDAKQPASRAATKSPPRNGSAMLQDPHQMEQGGKQELRSPSGIGHQSGRGAQCI